MAQMTPHPIFITSTTWRACGPVKSVRASVSDLGRTGLKRTGVGFERKRGQGVPP